MTMTNLKAKQMDQNRYNSVMDKLGYRLVHADRRTVPTLKEISALEHLIGHELPEDYKDFVLKFGVTMSGRKHWLNRDENGIDHGGVDVFYGISPQSSYDLHNYINFYEPERLPQNLLPIAGGSGSEIVMSLAGKDRGHIYCWDPQEPFGGENTEYVAKSFDSFLRNLVASK
jgi:hypothetical protein